MRAGTHPTARTMFVGRRGAMSFPAALYFASKKRCQDDFSGVLRGRPRGRRVRFRPRRAAVLAFHKALPSGAPPTAYGLAMHLLELILGHRAIQFRQPAAGWVGGPFTQMRAQNRGVFLGRGPCKGRTPPPILRTPHQAGAQGVGLHVSAQGQEVRVLLSREALEPSLIQRPFSRWSGNARASDACGSPSPTASRSIGCCGERLAPRDANGLASGSTKAAAPRPAAKATPPRSVRTPRSQRGFSNITSRITRRLRR